MHKEMEEKIKERIKNAIEKSKETKGL